LATKVGIWPVGEQQPVVSVSSLDNSRTQMPPASPLEAASFPEEEEAESEAEIAPETAAASGSFSGYSKECNFPDPRQGASASVRAALRQIIERDGPLPRESVYRLYVAGCPELQRVGRAVRQALNRALGTMLRSGEIVQEDELGGSPEGVVVRLVEKPKVWERPRGQRDLLEIPPSELFAILSRRSCAGSSNDEELLRHVLDHYGFAKLTNKRRAYLERVLLAWRREGAASLEAAAT
jgi:hypothetical protein